MPTIPQLPSADAVSATDLVPISQSGSVHSVSLGVLLAQTQPAIIIDPPSLLGRFSLGSGGPDTIAIGLGLNLTQGTLSADAFDLGSLPLQANLLPQDKMIVTSAGTMQLADITHVRSIFTAGSNINIDNSGVISAISSGSASQNRLTTLATIGTLTSGDLVGVSHGGEDCSIPYSGLLDGVTIDQASPADPASDGDSFWVAQTNNVLVRQTLSAMWPWFLEKLRSWQRPIIELGANTTLSDALHNNAILICSAPISVTTILASIASGFSCDLINLSSGTVGFIGNIVTSNGANWLAPYQSAVIRCFSYSGGTMIFGSISAAGLATVVPGQATNLTVSSLTTTSASLSWSVPSSGGAVSTYIIQYRITGSTTWLLAGQNGGSSSFALSGLQPGASYDFSVVSTNNAGSGPPSAILTIGMPGAGSPPGAPTAVTVTNTTANVITLSWVAPVVGGSGLTYQVHYRVSGQGTWNVVAGGTASTTIAIPGLIAATTYDVQVTATDQASSGPASATVTGQTAQSVGSVTSVTWNAVPIGSFTHGVGAIGVNAHVNPATAQVQFGFSTSSTVSPTTWVTGILVNSDLWGAYVPTPSISGVWYAWVEGTDGSTPTVYITPFTVT